MGIIEFGRRTGRRRAAAALAVVATIAAGFSAAAGDGKPLETRCGWFSNPSPANMTLIDRDGEWLIGEMGGHQAEGDWDWPKFARGEWKQTNGNYGYGCACFRLRADASAHRVLFVEKAWKKPLSACESDPTLNTKKPVF